MVGMFSLASYPLRIFSPSSYHISPNAITKPQLGASASIKEQPSWIPIANTVSNRIRYTNILVSKLSPRYHTTKKWFVDIGSHPTRCLNQLPRSYHIHSQTFNHVGKEDIMFNSEDVNKGQELQTKNHQSEQFELIENHQMSHPSDSTVNQVESNLDQSQYSKNQSEPNLDQGPNFVTINWILKNGEIFSTQESMGMNLLEVAHKHEIELEGACEGSLACSTCHVIITDPELYFKTGEITDEENDMLDLASGLTETSRLGCQVKLTKELDNIHVQIPSTTRNMMVDGHVPKPH